MTAGLRVGVTAGRRGGELVEALTRLGASVVWAPTVEVVPTPAGTVYRQTEIALDARPAWVVVATATDTLVVLMGLGRLDQIVDALLAAGRHPDTPAAVVSRGSLPDQRVVGAELGRLPAAVAATDLPGPALLVVGDVVRLSERIAWFGAEAPLRPLQDRIP